MEVLKIERMFLKNNVRELRDRYPGNYLLIKSEQVHGFFETRDQGVEVGVRLFGRGPFLVGSVANPEPNPVEIPALIAGIPLSSSGNS